jgi:dihydrofolate synthase/folylpolyglutamate synthase
MAFFKGDNLMNYSESLQYLNDIAAFGGELGLENINHLLDALEHPEKDLKVIHIAGTNGKGSVSHLTANILSAASYKVGLFTSPYILSYNEAIAINHQQISDDDFAHSTTLVKNACQHLIQKGYHQPTEFECLVAIALIYFKLQKTDYAVIEVGLGGRLDATNVFTTPLLSIITSISLDHTEYLGNTVEKIATEKAGIIKKGCPVVLGPSENSVFTVIKTLATKKQAPFYALSLEETPVKETLTAHYIRNFSVNNPYYQYENLSTKLLGKHQLININTALLGINVLKTHHNIVITEENIKSGIMNTTINCRCEYWQRPRPLLIDGAHNFDSTHALSQVLSEYFKDHEISILFGALGDKDVDGMLHLLSKHSKKIVLTLPLSGRAMPLESLATIARKYFDDITLLDDYKEAYTFAQSHSTHELICLVGSFYLVYPLREYILNTL